jgi:hypothetical protein
VISFDPLWSIFLVSNGTFTIDGVCKQGGDRLFEASNKLNMRIAQVSGVLTGELSLIEKGSTSVTMLDVLGNNVATLFSKFVDDENESFQFNISDMPEGVYFCVLRTPNQLLYKQLMIIK